MTNAFGVEHEPISKGRAGPGLVPKVGTSAPVAARPGPANPKVPGVPTPDPSKAGAMKYLAKEKIKKNPFAVTGAVGGTGAAAGYAGSQFSSSRNRY